MYVEDQEPAYCPAEHYHQIITILGKHIKSTSKAIKLNNRCHSSPNQNTCILTNFDPIENLKLLVIFSWFIRIDAIFSCFFYDYIIHPYPILSWHCLQQWASILGTVWSDVYMCLSPMAITAPTQNRQLAHLQIGGGLQPSWIYDPYWATAQSHVWG